MPLVIDCCALVHAKALSKLRHAPLSLLSELAEGDHVRFACTKPVLGELECSSLSVQLAEWQGRGWIQIASPTMNERRQVLNSLRVSDAQPGKNDVGLVVIAHRLAAPLLTHDGAAAVLARRCGLTTVDLVDLTAWAARLERVDLAQLSEAWGSLAGFPWPGTSAPWSGSVAATLANRPRIEAVLSTLLERGH